MTGLIKFFKAQRSQSGFCSKCNNNMKIINAKKVKKTDSDGKKHYSAVPNLKFICPECRKQNKLKRDKERRARRIGNYKQNKR